MDSARAFHIFLLGETISPVIDIVGNEVAMYKQILDEENMDEWEYMLEIKAETPEKAWIFAIIEVYLRS